MSSKFEITDLCYYSFRIQIWYLSILGTKIEQDVAQHVHHDTCGRNHPKVCQDDVGGLICSSSLSK